MNSERRKRLRAAKDHIMTAKDIISDVIDDEQYALNSVPDSLQASDAFEERENALDDLCDALDDLCSVEDAIASIL